MPIAASTTIHAKQYGFILSQKIEPRKSNQEN